MSAESTQDIIIFDLCLLAYLSKWFTLENFGKLGPVDFLSTTL
jgi:hypothetical protein